MSALLRWAIGFVVVEGLMSLVPQLQPYHDAIKSAVAAALAVLIHEGIKWHLGKPDLSPEPARVISDGGQAEDQNLPIAQPGPSGPCIISDGGLSTDCDIKPGQPNQSGPPYDPDPTGGEG